MTQNHQPDSIAVLEALKRMSPVVAVTVIALTSYFNLQSQISELRTRGDIQDASVTETLLEIRQDLKDLKRSAVYDEAERRNNVLKRDPTKP